MTGLTPVRFAKPVAPAPRLSAPRVHGRHAERFWRPEEEGVLRERYPQGGVAACEAHLARLGTPKRTQRQIYARAHHLGLRLATRNQTPRRSLAHMRTAEMDEAIRAGWAELEGRGSVQRFADELGVPRTELSHRALALGLTLPHRKEPAWTATEDTLLSTLPLHDLHKAAAVMREHGFSRTPAAIGIRAKRLSISRRRSDVFSGTSAARLLGFDNKTVTSWCIAGSMPATRRGTARLPQQGGDTWTITRPDLRQWIIDNLDQIDIRRVDKHAFVDLLVSTSLGENASAGVESDVGRDAPPMPEPVPVSIAPCRKTRSVKAKPAKRTLAEILADCGTDTSATRPAA